MVLVMGELDKLWDNVYKIWTKGRGFKLEEIIEETDEYKKALFTKNGKEKAFVIVTVESISVQDVRSIIEEVEEFQANKIMVATVDKVTTSALKEGREAGIEFIHKGNPLIYIFDHYLVPIHRVLPADKAREVVQRYANGKKELLPKILISDPAVRILGAKVGDVIEVRRVVPPLEELTKKYGKEHGEEIYKLLKELTPAGEEVFYRVVIEEAEEFSF